MKKKKNTTKRNFLKKIMPKYLYNILYINLESGKIARNTIWLFGEKFVKMLLAITVGVWIARFLGPERFGILNYALAIVGFFAPLASLGLNHILTRDVINNRMCEGVILGTAFWLRLIAGFLCIFTAVGVIRILRPNDIIMVLFVGCLSIGQMFKAFIVINYWFQSYVQSKYVVIARTVAFLFCAVLKIILILVHASLFAFIVAFTLELALIEICLVAAYRIRGQSLRTWYFNWQSAKKYLMSTWPLIMSGFAAVIYLKIDRIMLGQMISDKAVGIYSAAARISEVWYVVPTSYAASVFPSLIKLREEHPQIYLRRLQQSYDFLATLGLVIALPISFLAKPIVLLLFGEPYRAAAIVLSIHIYASVFIFMRALLSKWLLAENLLFLSLITHGGGAIINIILNLLLIPSMGVVGAAIATLVSYACASYFCLFLSRKTISTAIMMTRALCWPLRKSYQLLFVKPYK